GGIGGNDNRVVHCSMLFQHGKHVGYRGSLLADSHINTEYGLHTTRSCFGRMCVLLVDDGIERHNSFSCLAVANDKFALATTNRNQSINSLDTGLQRLVDRRTPDNTDSLAFDRKRFTIGIDRSTAVECNPKRIHNTTKQLFAYRYG